MEVQIGPITFIPGENSGKYPYCHSLYIDAEKKVLIDPASDRKRLMELRDAPGVDAVWLTHYHEDHFMHLDLFDDREPVDIRRRCACVKRYGSFLRRIRHDRGGMSSPGSP